MALQVSSHPRRTTPRRSSAAQAHAAYNFPSPVRGIDISQPLTGGDQQTALRMDNLIPRDLGVQLRRGYKRWVSNLGGEVRSLMQYHPPVGDPQMFAANDVGEVFDVTAALGSGVTPAPVLTVLGGQPPGEWTSINYTTDVGVHFMLMVNPGGGYWAYDGTTFTEIVAGVGPMQIDGVDPSTFAHIAVFKGHLVFVEMDTTRMWYLPAVGTIAGVAHSFDFGALFPNGGSLAMLLNWTFDGSAGGSGGTGGQGGGMDTKLVAIADQGDVLVYTGSLVTYPSPDFTLSGRWYIGRVPVGRRFAMPYSSDVVIVSERGLCFITELMRGEGFFSSTQTARQINAELAVQVTNNLTVRYWELEFLPREQLLIIKLPKYNNTDRQWAFEVNGRAFCGLLGIPMNTVEPFNGKSFCGDYDGNVWWIFDGFSDGEVDGVAGTDLQGMVVTAFQPLGDPVRMKRFLMVKPSFISDNAPGVLSKLNSEWDLGLPGVAPPYSASGDSFWDSAHWDMAVWSGQGNSYEAWAGAVGTGRFGSLSMRVRGAPDTVFVGWEALVQPGGIL